MELQTIVDRYAAAIAACDSTAQAARASRRGGTPYLPGFKALTEVEAVEAIDQWWATNHPLDFQPPPNMHDTRRAYPNLPGAKCDHVFTTDGATGDPEWAIEVKNIAFVGDNGKSNDYATPKMLSPYLTDRSLLHDAVRLRDQQYGRRRAVLGYAFRYDDDTCRRARHLHPNHLDVIEQIESAVEANDGELSVAPLLNFCNGILHIRNLVAGSMCTAPFEAWRHPCGGVGVVFAWEISNAPSPRHPW